MHEAQMHDESCFLTLTYNDKNLPPDQSLDRRAFPLFMRRLRRKVPAKLRYFHCGEYGDRNLRPHYHAALFGTGFGDRYPWADRNGHKTWRSPTLDDAWDKGQAEIGSLTFDSAGYIASYIQKKISISEYSSYEAHQRYARRYERVDRNTGELTEVEPEFATMSRKPGIGQSWLEAFHSDVFPSDEVIVNGVPTKPPRYYLDWLAAQDEDAATAVRERRENSRNREDETRTRLQVREVCATAKVKLKQKAL